MLKDFTKGRNISKEQFSSAAMELRPQLIALQQQLRDAKFPVLVIISGNEGAGKTETLNFLLEWLDTRSAHAQAFWKETDEECARPYYWRFWRAFPKKGEMGIFLGGWYTRPIEMRVLKKMSPAEFSVELKRIRNFEEMLSSEGALLIKFWLNLSKKDQKKRFKKLESDADTAWRVTRQDWKFLNKHAKLCRSADEALTATSVPGADWHVINAAQPRYRNLHLAKIITAELKHRLAKTPGSKPVPDHPAPKPGNALRKLNFSATLDCEEYEKELAHWGAKLAILSREMVAKKRSLVIGFEGTDAAGKGGAIRRLTQFLDARMYRVVPIAAPTDEERAMPWLWRFWRHIPMHGRAVIFDRTWYGRVLVERIEGFCAKNEWQRAYAEIKEFESQLVENGAVVLKFWLATSKAEQLKRFKLRETTEWKKFKITDEDWRNRGKWDYYEAAACDMFAKTSVPHAPWVLVEAENKLHSRIKVVKTVVQALELALK